MGKSKGRGLRIQWVRAEESPHMDGGWMSPLGYLKATAPWLSGARWKTVEVQDSIEDCRKNFRAELLGAYP